MFSASVQHQDTTNTFCIYTDNDITVKREKCIAMHAN